MSLGTIGPYGRFGTHIWAWAGACCRRALVYVCMGVGLGGDVSMCGGMGGKAHRKLSHCYYSTNF